MKTRQSLTHLGALSAPAAECPRFSIPLSKSNVLLFAKGRENRLHFLLYSPWREENH